MQKTTYQIACRPENRTVTGYRFDYGGHAFGIRKNEKGSGWRVDHIKTGLSIHAFHGPTRRRVVEIITERLPRYAEQIQRGADGLPQLNEV